MNEESMVRLYALEPIERAQRALKDISAIEQHDGEAKFFSLHTPPMLPSLGVEAVLEIDLPISHETIYQFAEPIPTEATHQHFRIPSYLMGNAKARLLDYEDLIKLADEVLDWEMLPSVVKVQEHLERRIADNQLEPSDALLLVALERRKQRLQAWM